MSRLIDANKLIQDITNTINEWIKEMPDGEYLKGNVNFAEMAKEIVRNQPTAFDVDKVINVIAKEIHKCNAELYADASTELTFNLPTVIAKRQALNEAFDIVKAGVIDE